jgi:hypothetical protein
MKHYRADTIGRDGHFLNCRPFSCDNDQDTIEWAKQLIDTCPVELWNGKRLVTKLAPVKQGSSPLN